MKGCTDHKGNKFVSIALMCNYYGVPTNTYHKRILRGWDKERALTNESQPKLCACQDHLGNKFSSLSEMCTYHTISHSVFYSRLQKGWSIERCLTTFTKNRQGNWVKTFDGKVFYSLSDMCLHYGILYETYHARIKRGWSQKRALTTPVKRR